MKRLAAIIAMVLCTVPCLAVDELLTEVTAAKTAIETNIWIVMPVVFGLMALFIGIKLAWKWLRRAARS